MPEPTPLSKTDLSPRAQLAIEQHVRAMLKRYFAPWSALLSVAAVLLPLITTTGILFIKSLAESSSIQAFESRKAAFDKWMIEEQRKIASLGAVAEVEIKLAKQGAAETSKAAILEVEAAQEEAKQAKIQAGKLQDEVAQLNMSLETLRKIRDDSESVAAAMAKDEKFVNVLQQEIEEKVRLAVEEKAEKAVIATAEKALLVTIGKSVDAKVLNAVKNDVAGLVAEKVKLALSDNIQVKSITANTLTVQDKQNGRFVIINPNGLEVSRGETRQISLSTGGDWPGLTLWNPEGNAPNFQISQNRGLAGIHFFEQNGNARGVIGIDNRGKFINSAFQFPQK